MNSVAIRIKTEGKEIFNLLEIEDWKQQLLQAEEFDLFFDKHTVKQMVQKLEEQEEVIYGLQETLRQEQQLNQKYEEKLRIYKLSDELVKEQSKKVKHLFPLENTVGYGQLCEKVLELNDDKSFFVKAYTEKIMKED